MPRLTAPVVPAGSLNAVEQPVLRAGDLLLRPWAEADADAVVTAFADPVLRRWHARSIASREEAVELISSYHRDWRAETGAHWAITGPGFVGRVALRTVDLGEGTAEMAYWVTPAARGRGVATRAVGVLGRWALRDLGLHRLELHHSAGTPPRAGWR